MADQVASFLFDSATVLMPALVLLSAIAIAYLIRHWPKRIWRRVTTVAALLFFVSVAGISGALLYAERNIRSIIERRVTRLTLHPLNGSFPARITDLHGQVVLVNFWATWCPPCRAEMTDLNRLADRYQSSNVRILTISDEPQERIALFEREVMALRTLVATFESDQPRGNLEMSAYQGRPTTVVLDENGRVREIFIGKQSYEKLQQAVERQLRRRV